MRTETVTCDGCGADLTTRTNSVDYRLVLASESKPGNGSGVYTDMHISPAIKRAHHFCGLDCLDRWRARELHVAGLWLAWRSKWQEEHGNGTPDLSREDRDALRKEFEATALEAFPLAPAKSDKPAFDRIAYQREYMRKRRAAQKAAQRKEI